MYIFNNAYVDSSVFSICFIYDFCSMKKYWLFFIVFFLFLNSNFASNEKYLTVKIKKGDTVYGLFTKYRIEKNTCNFEAFRTINQLKKKDAIKIGFSYKLPIQIFTYNKKSIRSTIGINNWDIALAVQDYNQELEDEKLKTYYLEDNILYVPYHFMNCFLGKKNNSSTIQGKSKPKLTRKSTIKTDLYFGKNVSLKKESNQLRNQVYYVISGHGGPDPGAMKKKGNHYLCEDEYAYDVSLRLAKILLEHGATVHMIIQDKNDGIRNQQLLKMDKDEICKLKGAIPLNQVKRLKQRVSAVNLLHAQEKKKGKKVHKVISIHVDSRSVGLEQDVFFYHAKGSKSGKKLASQIQNVFEEKYKKHQRGRGYKGSVTARNLYVLKHTNPTAVFVELANIQNKSNHRRILPVENRQALAKWLFEGLTK